MQPRTLEQILGELSSTYDPQINQIRQRQSLIPGQIADEEKGLQAKQEQAFGDILGGARRRGLGFSGIPLGEQARYTSTEFLPALARLKQSGRDQAMSLEDAILGVQERRNSLAQNIRQQESDRAEQARQFNTQLEAQRKAQLDASKLYGNQDKPGAAPDPIQQTGFNEAFTRINSQSPDELISDMVSTLRGNAAGVPKDKFKIETYRKYAPQLFTEAEKRFTGAQRTVNQPGLNILGQSPFSLMTGNLPAGLKFGQ